MSSRTETPRDPATDLLRLGGVHTLLVFAPLAILGLIIGPWWLLLPLAAVASVAVTAIRSRGIDDRVATRLGAREIEPGEHPRLESLVEALAMAVGVRPPRVFVIGDPAANAIAWGAGGGPPCIAVTSGLLEGSDRLQLEGVVAHVLADVRTAGVSTATVACALFEPVAGGPLAALVAALSTGEIEERRAVLTDLAAARATQYPPGLRAALEHLASTSTFVAVSPRTLQALWIAAPVEDERSGHFGSHPPLADRIDLLREL